MALELTPEAATGCLNQWTSARALEASESRSFADETLRLQNELARLQGKVAFSFPDLLSLSEEEAWRHLEAAYDSLGQARRIFDFQEGRR